jgi:hypothetical protein
MRAVLGSARLPLATHETFCGRRSQLVSVDGRALATKDTMTAVRKPKESFEHFCAPCQGEGKQHPGTMRLSIRLSDERGVLLWRDESDSGIHQARGPRGNGAHARLSSQ